MNEVFKKWHLGVTFGFRAENGWFSSEEAKKEADSIAASGADWVVLVVTVFQEHFYSTKQFKDFEKTPGDLEIAEIIDYLHSIGLKVQLRPMLETLDGAGRLAVWFPEDDINGARIPSTSRSQLTEWFKSMTERAVYYAKIAQKTDCEMYCLDSELDRLVIYNDRWKKVIEEVRKVYSGCLTSCHTTHLNLIDFEKALSKKNHWFHSLDALSLSCYHMADKHGMTKEEMVKGFESQIIRFRSFAQLYKKPILFGEFGCNFEPMEQANYLSTVIEAFSEEEWWYGLYWWKWDEQVSRPKTDRWYPIKDRPAADIYKLWGKKDRTRNIK